MPANEGGAGPPTARPGPRANPTSEGQIRTGEPNDPATSTEYALEVVNLAEILRVQAMGDDSWRAWPPDDADENHLFGGQVAAQALRAAALTVDPGHLPNSVHCYFLRRGQARRPIDITVERVRAGRTYSSRRIDVRQQGLTILSMLASFHVEEPGPEFGRIMPTAVPAPDAIPVEEARYPWERPLDMRTVPVESPAVRWWGRVRSPFPPDPVLQLCALLYVSDLRSAIAALAAVGVRPKMDPQLSRQPNAGNAGSLDHALWFHRIPTVTDWVFCDVRPLAVRDSRGLVLGTMFDGDGRHLATFTQEIFMKETRPGAGRVS